MGQFAQCCISLRADVMFYVSFYSGNFRVTGVLTNLEPFFVSPAFSDRPDVVSAVSTLQESPVAFSHCCYCQNTRKHYDLKAIAWKHLCSCVTLNCWCNCLFVTVVFFLVNVIKLVIICHHLYIVMLLYY